MYCYSEATCVGKGTFCGVETALGFGGKYSSAWVIAVRSVWARCGGPGFWGARDTRSGVWKCCL